MSENTHNLISTDRIFLLEVIERIENRCNRPVNRDAYERSKELWPNRNRFLETYLKSLQLRVNGLNGARLDFQTRGALISQAVSLMDTRMLKIKGERMDEKQIIEIEELEQKIAPDGGETVLPLAGVKHPHK